MKNYKLPKLNKIYFDHAATTPLDPRVLKAMMPYMQEKYGNASSAHGLGREAMAGINKTRKILACFLNCATDEIFFTSGATEGNNLALQGILKNFFYAYRKKLNKFIPHIITSQIEHPAVLEVFRFFEKEGVEVTYVRAGHDGLVNTSDVQKAIKSNTVLVSIMYVNNEIGTIQPIREIGKLIEKHNRVKEKELKISPLALRDKFIARTVFHTDATQAVNYCNCDVKYLHVDMLSMSGHKIYGPKGIGLLYVKDGINIEPIMYGGHQENGFRSGTYNTAGIVGLGKAIELISERENIKILKLRDKVIKEVTKKLTDVYVNGSLKNRIQGNINFSFKNVEGESLMIMLDMEGIAVSTGSACSSGSTEASYVLKAMGVAPKLTEGSIRITLGKNNTSEEVDYFIEKLVKSVNKLRKFSGG